MAPGHVLDRLRPACCSAVESFVRARHEDAHNRKVTGARSLINNSRSVREELRLQPSRRNVKHEQVQDQKFANIERENMRLLLRMQEIGRRDNDPRPSFELGGGTASKAAARIVLGSVPPPVPAPVPVPKRNTGRCSSLPAVGRGSNCNARTRELRRIDEENRKLLNRLNGARPTLSNNRMEREHQAQQKVMRMRQENGAKVPGSRLPLPFSEVLPDDSTDPENDRIEGLHAALQRRVEELEREEAGPEEYDQPAFASVVASPTSPASPLEEAGAGEVREAREYVGGTLPEHSRLLVEQLMAEEREAAKALDREAAKASPLDDEAAPQDDRDAVSRMLAAANALESQEIDPLSGANDHHRFLSYENVVQRSRVQAKLQAADRLFSDQS